MPQTFTATGEQTLPVQWWEHLDDPSLHILIEAALVDNPSLAATWDRLDQAKAIARREGADLSPQIDADARASTSRRRTAAGERGQQSFSLGLVASYEVDLWGRIASSTRAARLDAAASFADVQASAITLSASVASTWYQLIEARGQVALLESQIEINRQVLDLIELRFRRGLSPLADVLRQRQLLFARQRQLEQAQVNERVVLHQLNALLARPVTTPIDTSNASLAPPPALPDTGVPLALIHRRPDIAEAAINVWAQDQRLDAALADRYPSLTLSANAGFTSDKVRDLLDNWLATLAAELMQPIIDGGQRRAEIDRVAATVSEQINLYRATILTATQEVEDALAQDVTQAELVELLEQQVELSEQILERTRDGYLNRGLEYLDVLTALDNNQSLGQDLLIAKRLQIEFRIALCRALAGPPRLVKPEPRALASRTSPNSTSQESTDADE